MSPVTPDEVRAYALGKPEAYEEETWGHPTFRVGGHIFVGLAEDDATVTLHTSQAEQDELTDRDPGTFAPAPRMGSRGWTTAALAGLDRTRLHALVDASYDRTAG